MIFEDKKQWKGNTALGDLSSWFKGIL